MSENHQMKSSPPVSHYLLKRRQVNRLLLQITGMGLVTQSFFVHVSAQEPAEQEAAQADTLALSHQALIQKAFEMKALAVEQGDQAYGAIVVKDNQVIGLGPSRVVTHTDATAHAEMEAIRDACRHLKSNSLRGCILYSTSPPCKMCESAAYWAGIQQMIYGEKGSDGGNPQYPGC